MVKKIILYTEVKFIPKGGKHTIMLYPFWGNNDIDKNDPDFCRFDHYCSCANNFISITNNPNESDAFLLPFEFQFAQPYIEIAEEMASKAKEVNKKLLVFYNSDDSSPITIDNTLIFRTSFFKSSRKPNEYSLPGWSSDFKKISSKTINAIQKELLPKISYCGYVDYLKLDLKSRIKKLISKPTSMNELEKGKILRGLAVRQLLKQPKINTEFIIRDGFWAPNISKLIARQEYLTNIDSSPYALVIRGAGNFSYRLYEVLSAGRIPVFLNTDCVLPFEEFIDWKNYCVWVDDINYLPQTLVEFHKNISENDFLSLQIAIRNLYEEWISPSSFFKKIHLYI